MSLEVNSSQSNVDDSCLKSLDWFRELVKDEDDGEAAEVISEKRNCCHLATFVM